MDYRKDILLLSAQNKNLFITEFCASQASYKRESYPQMRNSYILHIIIKGILNFEDKKISRGQAFLFSENIPYKFSFQSGFKHFWIGFSGYGAESLLNSFNISSTKHTALRVENIDFIEHYLKENMEKLRETKDEREALLVLLTILAHLSPTDKTESVSYAERAKFFIDNNYPYKISMEDVAERINISEKHLCKVFKKEYRISPKEYLTSVRMKVAKKLLNSTDMLVKEVAENTGFASQLAFSTAYKKCFGISPLNERMGL